jgi:hypothetical protein
MSQRSYSIALDACALSGCMTAQVYLLGAYCRPEAFCHVLINSELVCPRWTMRQGTFANVKVR